MDAADTFSTVLKRFEGWMASHGLNTKHKCILVTDGPWDMAQFFHGQCKVRKFLNFLVVKGSLILWYVRSFVMIHYLYLPLLGCWSTVSLMGKKVVEYSKSIQNLLQNKNGR